MRCVNSVDAYFAAVANDICDGVASQIYGARSTRESDSLDADFVEHGSDQRELHVGRSNGKLYDAVSDQLLPRDGIANQE